ncbi:hypothetical protein SK3146_05618 [Paenibacillus konkukensis]|uniref:Uncharacterized protein n=1 Tax=Paenibacillus konkukensis TaxID=2020716 RepID=A0ABY4RVF0_9BACL|nr:hypothetical protein [Paenibacillus konkukensis]UQZ86325.1 hypothetical protein SK3146_05618 [Paenibacillus konkukensis]
MSEFTAGTLFRTSDFADETFGATLTDKDRIEILNDTWSVILMEDEYLGDSATVEKLAGLSRKKPLLYFYNAEDHGWGFKVFDDGRITSSLDVSYDLEYSYFCKLAEERYPGEIPHALPKELTDEMFEEVKRLPEFLKETEEQYAGVRPEAFQRFEIDIEELRDLFSEEYRHHLEFIHDLVYEFKTIMGFKEMRWVNYDMDLSNR